MSAADIGVAMGRGGTDVAREAASLVLLDDDFATIVLAIREGRRIYDNIRKFVRYAMTGNSAEILTICLAPLAGLPLPLLPLHILWVNLVTDGLPGLALAAEPAAADLMRRPPRPPRESLFAHGVWQHVLWVGGLMAAVCLLVQAWARRGAARSVRSAGPAEGRACPRLKRAIGELRSGAFVPGVSRPQATRPERQSWSICSGP